MLKLKAWIRGHSLTVMKPTLMLQMSAYNVCLDENHEPLPITQTKSCLNWNLVRRNIHWSVPLIIAGSSNLFESLRDSEMLLEFEKFLLIFKGLPASALVFIVVLFCKILTEFASNFSVSVLCDVNPHYLMMASTLASCLPFHLVTGAPVNAMVSAYVNIPPWKMVSKFLNISIMQNNLIEGTSSRPQMYAGLGPSVISVIVVWFTVAVWSNAIWTDITISPQWAHTNIFGILNKQN
ncbi:hypothetical protein HF086_001597 [Spodoptera exigua]|uniref:Uncharacterized protein n=1 Tax=Spodoptera exigua TaxID=7107 RepID=A0A922SKL1_SPOEX|nr:hypothetical protein HF086_001597 [Spodoptera exigua]